MTTAGGPFSPRLPAAEPTRGFTLLEVLVAMTILSIVAVFIVRLCGDSQRQLAATAWQDTMALEGRNRMIELACRLPANAPVTQLEQWGTLAPTWPDVQWTSAVRPLEDFPFYSVTFRLFEPSSGRELTLERFVPRPDAKGKP